MHSTTKQKIKLMALFALATAACALQTGCQTNGGYIGLGGSGNLNNFNLFPMGNAHGHSYNGRSSSYYNISPNGFSLPSINFGTFRSFGD